MIKLIGLSLLGPDRLSLVFSDGSQGEWSAADLIARNTVMTRPLKDRDYFARAFIEAGALAWPNGLEFSAASLHRRLSEAGQLQQAAA
jgi:hypothetical protein